MKIYGNAVLAAFQAQYKNIDEIDELVRQRRFKAVIGGANSAEWDDIFWKNIAIMIANGVKNELPL